MTESAPKPKNDAQKAAYFWYARMSSDARAAADQNAFDAWLSSSPEHADAYTEAHLLMSRFDAVEKHPEIAALRAEAQARTKTKTRPWLPRFTGAWIATGLAAAAAAMILHLSLTPLETGEWTTARGETLEVSLSDGSEIVLGSDSQIEMQFWRGRRSIELTRGQAFFDAAHDESRPFTVAAAGQKVTVLGTAFDVRSYPNETAVTLLRGRVSISRDDSHGDIVLQPGQQFQVSFGVVSVRDIDASIATSWRTGVLEFEDTALGDAVTQLNRSSARSIIITDQRIASLRIAGVFRAGDPAGFVAALAPIHPIIATLQSSGDIVLSYRSQSGRMQAR